MTPTFRVIDKHTGREYSEENINTDGLMEMDLDQMFLGEDGTLVMADDCDRIAYQDGERFYVLIDGYVSIDRVLEIIDSEAWSYCDYIIKHENGNSDKQVAASLLSENIREAVLALKGSKSE